MPKKQNLKAAKKTGHHNKLTVILYPEWFYRINRYRNSTVSLILWAFLDLPPSPLAPPEQVLTCTVRCCARPCPVGCAVPSHEPRGFVAFPAGIDDRAGEEDPIAAEDHPIGGGARVSTGYGCQEAKTVAHKGVSQDRSLRHGRPMNVSSWWEWGNICVG